MKNGDSDDQKYTKLRLSNQKVQDDIINVPGAIDLMLAVGFQITEINAPDGKLEDFLFYDFSLHSSKPLEVTVNILNDLLDRLGAS